MTTDPDLHEPAAGRQITLEPMRPGLWLIIGGAVIAALGPLFGFLVGSMIGTYFGGPLGQAIGQQLGSWLGGIVGEGMTDAVGFN